MPEREHFTNGRSFTAGTGITLLVAAFGAQISGWTHWISIGAGYGVGSLLSLIATAQITKSYYSRHPELPAGDTAALPASGQLSLAVASSKLVIHSAYFGVEGGPDEEVAEKYLRPRILGNALAGWVGSDLFGALDPAIGRHKRLKVRYSFEGREETIERAENTFLVLPKDLTSDRELQKLKDDLAESANRNLEYRAKLGVFTALQLETLTVASNLIEFLKDIGPAPPPKYSRDQIFKMSSEETKRLIESNDGDFSEACAYHEGDNRVFPLSGDMLYEGMRNRHTRLVPWYEKFSARYAMEWEAQVKETQNRLTVEGFSDADFTIPTQGFDAPKNVRQIANTLWNLAFKVGEKTIEKA